MRGPCPVGLCHLPPSAALSPPLAAPALPVFRTLVPRPPGRNKKKRLPGIIFSSLGAGMQCLVGASRLVAAIANDHTIPLLRPFAPKPDEEPTRALYAVWLLASLPCLAGNLDYITPIMTMFFLLMWATTRRVYLLPGKGFTWSLRSHRVGLESVGSAIGRRGLF